MPRRPSPPSVDPIDRQVAARLRARRLALRLDPRLVDVAIGEPLGTVAKFEDAKRRIGAAQLFRLSRVLAVDISYFFAGRPAAKGPPPAATAAPAASASAREIADAHRFLRAYTRLDDPEVRRMVLKLVRSLAATAFPPDDDEAPAR